MTETIHLRDGKAIKLGPCPPWCTTVQHFDDDDIIDPDDGFYHYAPRVTVATDDRMLASEPETVVKVILKAWACPPGADHGPGIVEVNLGTGEYDTDMSVDLTPSQARALAAALAKLADTAERTMGEGH